MENELQFEKAELTTPNAMCCTSCQSSLLTDYFAANGQLLCAECAAKTKEFLAGTGMGVGRFFRATLLGAGAAILGAMVYGGIMMATNMEIGLISIAVGWFVGIAVRKGSLGRGGWRYQLLAALSTYTSVCLAYASVVLAGAGGISFELVAGVIIMLFALPFLGGTENLLGWLIIGFGVWQAWQMNRPGQVEVTGPHAIGDSLAPVANAGA